MAVAVATGVLVSLIFGIAAASWQALRAQASDRQARHLLYMANMNLAEKAWDENNVARVQELLNETASNAKRGFEWYYWEQQTHLATHTLKPHHAQVNSAAFSPDGKRILTGSFDHAARMWDAASGEEIFEVNADTYAVRAVAFSPDGKRFVTGGRNQTKIRDADTGQELLTLKGDSDVIWSIAFSPDGRHLAAGRWDSIAAVWDAATGDELFELQGHSTSVWAVAFSPDVAISSPSWHGDVLASRKGRAQRGETQFLTLEQLSDRLQLRDEVEVPIPCALI